MVEVETVPEEIRDAMRRFCGICDNYMKDGSCRVVGGDDQRWYVMRNWCGWASIEGVSVQQLTAATATVNGRPYLRSDEESLKEALRAIAEKVKRDG